MWIPKYISFKNLLSHTDSEYFFPEKGQTTLVYGLNEDDGFESNGSGKSAFLEAIAIGLTGDSFRKVKIAELVKNGEDNLHIIFLLENKLTNSVLKIERKIYSSSKASSCIVSVNDVEDKVCKDLKIDLKNKRIFELLGITKDDLLNYYLISKDTYTSFFSAGDVAKKEIINRFSNAILLDPVLKKVEEDIDEKEELVEELDSNKKRLFDSMNTLSESIAEREEEFENAKKLIIGELKSEIEELKSSLDEERREKKKKEKELETENKDLLKLKKQLESLDDEAKKKLESEIEDLEKGYQENLELIEEIEEVKRECERHLKGAVECPECKHKFVLDNKEFNLEEAPSVIKEIEEELPIHKSKSDKIREKLRKLKNDVLLIDRERIEKESDIKIKQSLIKTIQRSLEDSDRLLKREEDRINDKEEKLKVEKSRTLNNDKVLTSKKEKLAEEKVSYLEKSKEYGKEVSSLDKLKQQLLIFKKYKSYLANKSIGAIEHYSNYYLQNMGTDMEVSIDGFRLLADSRIKEEITTTVSRNGLDKENFFKFSGGERARIDVSVILSMQYLINLSSNTGGLDLLFLDEIVESVDGEGVRQVINCLSQLDKLIFVVTHTNPNQDFDYKLVIVKKNGESKIDN